MLNQFNTAIKLNSLFWERNATSCIKSCEAEAAAKFQRSHAPVSMAKMAFPPHITDFFGKRDSVSGI